MAKIENDRQWQVKKKLKQVNKWLKKQAKRGQEGKKGKEND